LNARGLAPALNRYSADLDWIVGPVVVLVARHARNLLHDVNAGFIALANDRVLAVKKRRRYFRYEELRTVGIAAFICHGHAARPIKFHFRADLIEHVISGTARTVSGGIAALNHEARDDAME